MFERLRVWWRGWSEADARSMRDKFSQSYRPGAAVFLTDREFRAFQATVIMVPK